MYSKLIARIAIAAIVVAAAAAAWIYRDRIDIGRLEALVNSAGPLGPVAYMAAYALATVLFVPGALFGLAGGALFGPVWGSVWNLAGATIGATFSFLVARYLAAGWVERRSGGVLKRLVQGVEAEGWRFVAVTRLVPFVPFNMLNYALGLSRIRLDHYILASLICMAPGAIAYTWLGYAGKEALAGNAAAMRYALLALGVLALIAFVPRFARRLRAVGSTWIEARELKAQLESGKPPVVIDVRNPDEFEGELGHIESAQNLPVGEIPNRISELDPIRKRAIAVVCRTDKRSARAAEMLRGAGFGKVAVLRGGMEHWHAAGYRVARSRALAAKIEETPA
ncbi:MAG: VTT domain-containing protein [Alphaproteobacteria bacterium]